MAKADFYRVGGLIVVLFFFFYITRSSGYSFMAAPNISGKQTTNLRGQCRTVWCMSKMDNIQFGVVADLDRMSKVADSKKPQWKSYFKHGSLVKTGDAASNGEPVWSIQWEDDIEMRSAVGEAGRGFELSELVSWQNKLWTFDDRTGLVYEVNKKHQCIPKHILMEGDGENTKGQKTEWATVKDGKLYVGSFGKVFTNTAHEIVSTNNLWVSILDSNGDQTHEDWTVYYRKMQEATNSQHPGYMIHEAIHWDEINRLWYVLPRRVSHEEYDEKKDETMGSNLLLTFNEDFSQLISKKEIGKLERTHGWSSFKFVPWTGNKVILGLRTMEVEDKATGDAEQKTFITLFDVEGNVFLPEQQIPGDYKFEGLEFL